MTVIPYPQLKLQLQQPPALKLQFLPAIPGGNVASKVNRSGDTMTGTLILAGDPTAPLGAATKQYVDTHSGVAIPNIDRVITLADGATVPLDASQGNQFKLLAAGNRTILAPSNPPASGYSQKIIIIHEAAGAPRTLSLTIGAGAFRFGTDLTAFTATPTGLADYIGAIWNQSDNCWDVVSYARGF